jgi:hypothetical protein
MTPFEQQRVTAEIEVVDPAVIISKRPVDDALPSTSALEYGVRFVSQSKSTHFATPQCRSATAHAAVAPKLVPSWAIVLASGVVTLLLGCLTMAAA